MKLGTWNFTQQEVNGWESLPWDALQRACGRTRPTPQLCSACRLTHGASSAEAEERGRVLWCILGAVEALVTLPPHSGVFTPGASWSWLREAHPDPLPGAGNSFTPPAPWVPRVSGGHGATGPGSGEGKGKGGKGAGTGVLCYRQAGAVTIAALLAHGLAGRWDFAGL